MGIYTHMLEGVSTRILRHCTHFIPASGCQECGMHLLTAPSGTSFTTKLGDTRRLFTRSRWSIAGSFLRDCGASISILSAVSLTLHAASDADIQALQAQLKDALQQIRQLSKKVDDLQLQRGPAAAPGAATTGKASEGKSGPAASPSGSSTVSSTGSGNPGLSDYDRSSNMTIKEASDAFAVPDSPAAAALGISPDKVQHVSTPKQLVPTIVNGLDDRGNFQSGLAVDFAPGQWWLGKKNLSEFQQGNILFSDLALDDYLQRLALRTQFSFAYVHGTTDTDKSSKIALGVHTVLLEANDPVLKGVSREDRYAPEGLPLNAWVRDVEDNEASAFSKLVSRLSSSVGAAPTWISPDGSTDNYQYDGTTAWGALSYRPAPNKDKDDHTMGALLHSTNFSVNAIYHNGELISQEYAINKPGKGTSSTAMISQDSLFLVGGMEIGTHTNRAVLTGALVELNQHALGSETLFRYGITLEHQLPQTNTWITLSITQDTSHKNNENPTLVVGGVKFGLGGNDFYAKDKSDKQSEIKSMQ